MSQPLVYSSRTWLTEPLAITDDTIYLDNINNITNTIVQTATAPVAVSGVMSIGLYANKNTIVNIVVYNNTTSAVISSSHYTLVVIDTVPTLRITTGAWIATGNSLTITTIDGNLIYINGEQIKFGSVNTTDNTLSNLSRGQNVTPAEYLIAKYTEVWGLLPKNKMNNVGYVNTWNSYNYNTVIGDPLQISTTSEALFLTNNKYKKPFPIISPFSLTTTTTLPPAPPTTTTTSTSTSTTSTSTSTTSTTTSGPTTTTTSTTTAGPTTTTTTTLGPTTTTTTLAPTTTTTTSGSGPVSPLGFNGKNYTYSGESAQLTLAIYSDGTWQLIPTNSGPTPTTYNDLTSWNTITGNWYSPTTPGIGSSYIYWIQTNSQNQANDGIVGTSIPTSTWVPFPVTSESVAYVSISAAGGDDAEGNFTFKVGQNIITPVILSTSTFTLHGYSATSGTTTTTTAAPSTTTTTTSAPSTTTTTTSAPSTTTTTTAAPTTTTTTASSGTLLVTNQSSSSGNPVGIDSCSSGATITYYANGILNLYSFTNSDSGGFNESNVNISGQWLTGGDPSQYYMYVTSVSGYGTYSGQTTGTWLQMNVDRGFGCSASAPSPSPNSASSGAVWDVAFRLGAGPTLATVTIDVSSDASTSGI